AFPFVIVKVAILMEKRTNGVATAVQTHPFDAGVASSGITSHFAANHHLKAVAGTNITGKVYLFLKNMCGTYDFIVVEASAFGAHIKTAFDLASVHAF